MSPAQIRAMIERAKASVRSAFRGVLGQIDTTKPIQLANIDGLAGEPLPGLELLQQFGFTSAPPAGTTVIALPLGGRTSASVIVATEHSAHRFTLTQDGEVAIYNQDHDYIWLKRDGHIKVKSSVSVEIESPLVSTTGDLAVGGNINAAGSITDLAESGGVSMGDMRSVYNGHTHGAGPTPNQSM